MAVALEGGEAHAGEEVTVLGQAVEAGGEGTGIVRGDEEAVCAVGDDLARGAQGGADGGETEAHAFEVDDAEAFVGGGQDEQVGLGE